MSTNNASNGPIRLAERFPVNSLWELTLTGDDKVTGRIYCTDEGAQAVVVLETPADGSSNNNMPVRMVHAKYITQAKRQENDDDGAPPLSAPLPKVHKKQLEEREKKAIRLAEESFRQINPDASAEGQACFDRLLKACNEVVWNDQSILVLNQIQVDPPYTPETCKIVQRGGKKTLEDGSLDRVKKIVAANSSPTASATASPS